jgi:4-alpha-glucanotransferase
MNTPGTIVGNWSWHFEWQQLTEQYRAQFKQLLTDTGRAFNG